MLGVVVRILWFRVGRVVNNWNCVVKRWVFIVVRVIWVIILCELLSLWKVVKICGWNGNVWSLLWWYYLFVFVYWFG